MFINWKKRIVTLQGNITEIMIKIILESVNLKGNNFFSSTFTIADGNRVLGIIFEKFRFLCRCVLTKDVYSCHKSESTQYPPLSLISKKCQ